MRSEKSAVKKKPEIRGKLRDIPKFGLLCELTVLATYADGLSEDGESMFLDIPEPDLNARIAEFLELSSLQPSCATLLPEFEPQHHC